MGVVFTTRQSRGPLDSPLGASLRKCEQRIKNGEHDGIEARWEFGRQLLRQREGKQLPKGLTALITAEHGIGASEIKYRVQFAETFTTRDEVATAVATFGSWAAVKSKALPKTKRPKSAAEVVGVRLEFKQWRKRLTEIKASAADLTEADLRELDHIQEAIADIYVLREATTTASGGTK